MESESKYDQLVQKLIKEARHTISEISDLKNIYSALLDRELYPSVLRLLMDKKFNELPKDVSLTAGSFREYLEIYEFSDQLENKYVVTIYDSDELWQDPQIIDIIPL